MSYVFSNNPINTQTNSQTNSQNNSQTNSQNNSQTNSTQSKYDFWEFVKQQRKAKLDTINSTVQSDMKKEVDDYLNDTSSDKDIIKWWYNNKTKYPTLFNLALKYLCVPATSAPAERIFSKSGEILSKKRARLSSKHLNTLIFLNKNLKLLY